MTSTPPSGYAVRLASAADLAQVARCRFTWAEERGAGAAADGDVGFGTRFSAWWEATADRRFTWLAFPSQASDAVGMASLTVYERMPWPGQPDARWAYVGQLWVDPHHRNSGIGRLLMQELVGWARDEGMLRLVLNPSEMARPLYAGLGFRPASDLMRLDFPAPA